MRVGADRDRPVSSEILGTVAGLGCSVPLTPDSLEAPDEGDSNSG